MPNSMRIEASMLLLCIALSCAPAAVSAQGFPDTATAPPSADLQQMLAGHAFSIKRPNGAVWHVDYKSDGSFSMTADQGWKDTGEWKPEDGKLCTKGRKMSASCNEVRAKDGSLFLKRDNGEIVQLVAD